MIDNLEAICREIGGGLDNILKLTIFLTDLEKFDEVNQIMSKRFSEPFPARATIEISKLPKSFVPTSNDGICINIDPERLFPLIIVPEASVVIAKELASHNWMTLTYA